MFLGQIKFTLEKIDIPGQKHWSKEKIYQLDNYGRIKASLI
jgi:hypothetical protein